MASPSRRRGFWRLTFVIWVLGTVAAFAVGVLTVDGVVLSPTKAVRPDGLKEPSWSDLPQREQWRREQLIRETRRPDSGWVATESDESDEELLGRNHEAIRALEQLRVLWRSEAKPQALTLPYWKAWAVVLLWIGTWSAAIWGAFYTFSWVVAGFAKSRATN